MYLLSIIIPIYNEEENIPVLFERLNGVISQLKIEAEYIFINDGSKVIPFP
jgi:dolichol-phosphate mannosyltransferase